MSFNAEPPKHQLLISWSAVVDMSVQLLVAFSPDVFSPLRLSLHLIIAGLFGLVQLLHIKPPFLDLVLGVAWLIIPHFSNSLVILITF